MKYAKMIGLLAIAAAALTALAGTASATVTSSGTAYNGTVQSSSSNVSLDGAIDISCNKSTNEGTVSNGATSGTVTSVTYSECGNDTVTVLNLGTTSISSSGVVTTNGTEITALIHRSVFGFPVTTHCIYATNNTAIATLTEGASPAVNHIGSAAIPQKSTDSACGEEATLTGDYEITSPSGGITID